ADVALRVAVAVQAPFHVQRGLLPRQRHLVDRPVTGRAADALLDMDAVVEIGELGQVVDAHPGDRLIAAVALADRLGQRAVDPDLVVAVHAGARRRGAGELGGLGAGVAGAAGDAPGADVVGGGV